MPLFLYKDADEEDPGNAASGLRMALGAFGTFQRCGAIG